MVESSIGYLSMSSESNPREGLWLVLGIVVLSLWAKSCRDGFSQRSSSKSLTCGVEINCKEYDWLKGGNVRVQYLKGKRDVAIFTPIGKGTGRFEGGPGNIEAKVGSTSVKCLGQKYSPTGWGLCFVDD